MKAIKLFKIGVINFVSAKFEFRGVTRGRDNENSVGVGEGVLLAIFGDGEGRFHLFSKS